MDALQAIVLSFIATFFLHGGGCFYPLSGWTPNKSEAFTWKGNLIEIEAV